MSLEKIQKLSDTSIDGYKLISIERHPYEKAISYANFILGLAKYKRGGFLKASAEDICAYIDKSLDNGGLEAKISSWKIYSLNGECRTDYMLRHENLHETFTAACEDMELSPIPEMAVTKLGIRDRSLSAKEQLTPQQRKKIQDICSKEFEHFGYKA
jgi:hypothetical protein